MMKYLCVFAGLFVSTGTMVRLEDGLVEGIVKDGVAMWRGIPFAAPPVGDLRWRPPQPPKPWAPNVRNATDFGADCIQLFNYSLSGPTPQPGTSEDCLYVNVFAPAEKPKTAKPVFLWIYGGGFQGGGSSSYDGRYDVALANGELVFVSFNYRLNVFGFAASDVLRGRDPEGGTGNYGILDQRFAMEWTKRNVAAFGGDPSRMLIVGESAGADSVSNHLVRRKSWGLFSAAGIDSGAMYSLQPYMPGVRHLGPSPTNVTVAQQEPYFQALLAAAKCSDVACLLKLEEMELLKAMLVASPSQPWIWEPAIDGVDLIASGVSLAAAGELAPVPVIVGSNMEDAGQSATNCEPDTCTEEDFRAMVGSWEGFGVADIERAVEAYGDEDGRPIGDGWNKWYAAQMHFGTDSMMTCPSRRMARWVARNGQRAYWYYWAYMPKSANGINQQASHSCEIPFMFYDLQQLQPLEVSIATVFAKFWIDFAVNGTPGWPAYTQATNAAIVFHENQTVRLVEHHRNQRCDFWDAHLERWVTSTSPTLVVV